MVTKEQFAAYRKVQNEGKYNMFDQRAIQATGLSKEVYMDIIQNFSKYLEKYEK